MIALIRHCGPAASGNPVEMAAGFAHQPELPFFVQTTRSWRNKPLAYKVDKELPLLAFFADLGPLISCR
jgi:hypothetical protein